MTVLKYARGVTMRQLTSDEYKEIILQILVKVDSICRENNLKYSICFGTLLGAVRHKGFIPWDDDIDIFMPREDIPILEEKIKKSNPELICISPQTNLESYFPFTKVCAANTEIQESTFKKITGYGAYIDIFPFSYMPEGYVSKILYRNYTKLLEKAIQHSARVAPSETKSITRKILKRIAFVSTKAFDSHKLTVYLDNVMASMPKSSIGGNPWEALFLSRDYEELIEFDFEGYKFFGPKNYDHVLRESYGDYMQLPPESERINKHSIICYSIE